MPTTVVRRRSGRRAELLWLALALIWLGAIGTTAVLVAGAAVRAGRTVLPIDLPIVEQLRAHRTSGLTLAARVVSTVASPIGLWITLVLVVALVRWRWAQWQPAVLAVLTLGGIIGIGSGIKAWIHRPRPPLGLAVPDVPAHGFAFPSGHTGQSTAVYALLAVLIWRRYRSRPERWFAVAGAVIAAAAVGFARLYLGVHWFSDVLAGWALGLSWLAVVLAGAAAWTAGAARRSGADKVADK